MTQMIITWSEWFPVDCIIDSLINLHCETTDWSVTPHPVVYEVGSSAVVLKACVCVCVFYIKEI